jgi:hypothetical protein
MIDPRLVLVLAAVYSVIWLGSESIKGVRWVKHHAQHAIHHVLHPHAEPKK